MFSSWQGKKALASDRLATLTRNVYVASYRISILSRRRPKESIRIRRLETLGASWIRKIAQILRRLDYYDERMEACRTLDRFARAIRKPPL